jgi:penicillin-binding protein 1A
MSREIWEDDERDSGGAGSLIKKIVIGIGAAAGLVVLGFGGFLLVALQGLPGLDELKRYEPPITSRVHAGDGALVAEFAEEHRLFVPIAAIPDPVRQAFVAAEDQNFFQHSGVDFAGVLRATVSNIGNMVTGKRLEGASTITQQVAKNMLLTSDRTILRKVREAFLAQRIEQALDKERILEL